MLVQHKKTTIARAVAALLLAAAFLSPTHCFAASGVKWAKQVDFIPKGYSPKSVSTVDCSIMGMSDNGRYIAFSMHLWPKKGAPTKGQIYIRDMKKNRVKLVSKNAKGAKGNGWSDMPGQYTMSSNGRYTVFQSDARNLIKGDTNGKSDIFLYDRKRDRLRRISLGWNGKQSNGHSSFPLISGDGRYVFYASRATNIVKDGAKGRFGLYRYDVRKKTTLRIPLEKEHFGEGNVYYGRCRLSSVSANGRYVTFSKETKMEKIRDGVQACEYEIYRYDVDAGGLERVSNPASGGRLEMIVDVADKSDLNLNGLDNVSSVSSDGRYVAYVSNATNILPGKVPAGACAVYLYDCGTGKTVMVSNAQRGKGFAAEDGFPSFSPDGKYVTYIRWGAGKGSTIYTYGMDSGVRRQIKRFPFKWTKKNAGEENAPPASLLTSNNARYIGVSNIELSWTKIHSYVIKRR
jgi:Tol biopolymer transport system component